MSEIKVGEYVRTNEGYLGKLLEINKQYYNYLVVDTTLNIRNDEYPSTYLYLKNENIKNHGKDIIDLIEKSDYVNGEYVIQVSKELNCVFIETTYYDELLGEEKHNFIKAENIKSIVRKEQFEKVMYKVGD